VRRVGRVLVRRLGLPPLGARGWLVVVLLLLGLVVTTVLVADFVLRFGAFGPRYYEPKDFQREQHERAAEPRK
jgi:hypothetical protein